MSDQIKELEEKLERVSGEEKVNVLNKLSFSLYGSDPKKMLRCAEKALLLAEELQFKKGIAESYKNIGVFHWVIDNSEDAIDHTLKALRIYEDIGDQTGVAYAYTNIGIIYHQRDNYSKSLEYYFKSLNLSEEIGDKGNICLNLNNIGGVYNELKDYDAALDYYFKSLKYGYEINDKQKICLCLTGLGMTYEDLKDYEQAVEYQMKALKIQNEINDKCSKMSALRSIATVYQKTNRLAEAIYYAEQSFSTAQEIGSKYGLKEASRTLSEIYKALGNYEQAFVYLSGFVECSTQIFDEERNKKIAEMQTKYESEKTKKEAEIEHLKNIELQKEITYRKKAEEALTESEKKYRNLVESLEEGIGTVDEDENFLFINSAAANVFGYSEDELIGKNIRELTTPAEFQRILEQTTTRKVGETNRYEAEIIRKDGSIRLIKVIANPIIDDGGQYKGASAVFQDITEQKMTQDMLELEQQRLFSLMEAIPAFVYLLGPNHYIRFANQYFFDVFGDPAGKSFHESIFSDESSCPTLKVFETGEGQTWEKTTVDGRIFMINDVLLTDVGGSPLVLGVGIDITERKQAEESLQKSEAKNRALLDAIPDTVSVYNQDGICLDYRPEKGTPLYLPPEHYLGKNIAELIPTEISRRARLLIQQALRTGAVQNAEYQLLFPGEDYPRSFNARISPVSGKEQVLILTRDITERKLAEEKLQQTNSKLADALAYLEIINKEKNEYLGIVSHDLRNPISAILGCADILRLYKYRLSEEKQQQYLIRIEESGKQMLQLITNLLDVNRLESGKVNLEFEDFDLRFPLIEVIQNYVQQAISKDIDLRFEPPDDEVNIYGDENAMRQILDNLISNAVKYSPYGKNVSVRLSQSGEFIRLEIQDEGQGVTEDDQQKIFGKFARLSAQPTGDEHSTGLGLSIVKKLVELMNGRVWAESDGQDKGSTFIVEFMKAEDKK